MKKILISSAIMTGILSTSLFGENFSGVTIEAKLIGGQQYERLYSRIGLWEKKTGAKVKILSKKNHFELDKEIKSDIAAGTTSWCVASNHTSFAPQYGSLYIDLKEVMPKKYLGEFVPTLLKAGIVNNRQVMVPRAQFDVRALYYRKSLYNSSENKTGFEKEYGYALIPPKTWKEVKDQAIFFSKLPNMYGTQFAGKDEALNGTFFEFLVSEGGQMFDKDNKPTFNSKAGVRALQWFVDLYKAKGVPAGTISYLWDELGAGFASGTIAIDFDWGGWSGYFNDPKNSKAAGDIGILPPPKGSVRRTGWSGSHGFSITKKCSNKKAAASLIEFLTDDEAQVFESEKGSFPTRTNVWAKIKKDIANGNDQYKKDKMSAFGVAAEGAFPVPQIPEWLEVSNIMFPYLQKAILGDLTAKQALDKAQKDVYELMEENGYYK